MLVAYEVALEVIHSLRSVAIVIEQHDRALADQLRRAGSSIVLNIAEGQRSAKGNKGKHYSIAHGSANEVKAELDTALAWGWLEGAVAPMRLLDRLLGLLWGLTHPREK
jgi:four helix bundle protein